MPGETKHGIECTEFETLLSEAMDRDGQLTGAQKEGFEAHRRMCAVCGPLFADVQAGQQWLRLLGGSRASGASGAQHSGRHYWSLEHARAGDHARNRRTTPLGERLREWWDSFLAPVAAFVRQPRFVMSFGMIFFSFSLALNAAGVKPADVAKIDLRPTAVRHAYNDAANSGREVLRQHSFRVRNRIQGARDLSEPTPRRTRPESRTTTEAKSQERHQWTTRPETGS